jgi:hypothetical protein
MTVNYTTLLGLAQPVSGTEAGTWGDTVNTSVTQLVEDSVAGVATASVLSANWTLSTTGSGATNEARKAILIPTGSPGVSRNIIAPSLSKAYIVINQSNAAVVLKGAATTGVTIASGKTSIVAWNGSDFVEVTPNTISGVLPILNGGTGNTTGTATINANLTGAITSIGNAASLGSFTSANLAAALTDKTGTGVAVFASNPTFPAQVTLSSTSSSALVVSGGLQLGGNTASAVSKITSGLDWNFCPFSIVRAASNTATPRLFSLMLGGDSDASTSIGDYNAIWGIYDSAPTSTSTSISLNGKMAYGAYAGHQWYVNNSLKMLVTSSGNFGIGGSASSIASATIGKNITGGTVAYGSWVSAQVMTDVTNAAFGYASNLSLQTGSTLGELIHYYASQSTVSGSTVTTQTGFNVSASLTGATNNYGFYGGIAFATGRYNLYMAGTADNYLAGTLNIGSGAATGQNFRLAKTLTGATNTYGFVNQATIATDSTATATFNYTGISTAAAASIGSVTGYNITLDSLGAGSSIGTMTGYTTGAFTSATNNYGFYGAIPYGTGRYNLYMAGTADNYLAGSLGVGTASPNASAILDVQSTTKGVRMPNMTTTQKNAIASPAAGLMVFDTTLAKLCVYSGAAWQTITSV